MRNYQRLDRSSSKRMRDDSSSPRGSIFDNVSVEWSSQKHEGRQKEMRNANSYDRVSWLIIKRSPPLQYIHVHVHNRAGFSICNQLGNNNAPLGYIRIMDSISEQPLYNHALYCTYITPYIYMYVVVAISSTPFPYLPSQFPHHDESPTQQRQGSSDLRH